MMMEYLLLFFFFRSLLCNLVRVKLQCYELEGKNSQSVEDYLKAFMETEVKPLWPKGWMQARSVSIKWLPAHKRAYVEVSLVIFIMYMYPLFLCIITCTQDS